MFVSLLFLKIPEFEREMVLRVQSWPGDGVRGCRAERRNHSLPILLSVRNPGSHGWGTRGSLSSPRARSESRRRTGCARHTRKAGLLHVQLHREAQGPEVCTSVASEINSAVHQPPSLSWPPNPTARCI